MPKHLGPANSQATAPPEPPEPPTLEPFGGRIDLPPCCCIVKPQCHGHVCPLVRLDPKTSG